MISSFAKAEQHPPHLAVSYFQPRGCFDLCQMLLLYLVQHFQSVPFSLAQSDPLRFHGPLGPPWKRTSLLCTNRTFSLCSDRQLWTIRLFYGRRFETAGMRVPRRWFRV